jgi:hypothetical protein
MEIKELLDERLRTRLNLNLNKEKTKITHISEGFNFLGHILSRRVLISKSKSNIRRKVSIFILDTSKIEIIKKFAKAGFCDGSENPKSNFKHLRVPQSQTNDKINRIIRCYSEWFKYAGNRRSIMALIAYILRYSVAKVYAAKFKLRIVSKVFRKGGHGLSISLKNCDSIEVTKETMKKWADPLITQEIEWWEIPMKGIMYSRYWMISKTEEDRALSQHWKPDYFIRLQKFNTRIKAQKTTTHDKKILIQDLPIKKTKYTDISKKLHRSLTSNMRFFGGECSFFGPGETVQVHDVNSLRNMVRNRYGTRADRIEYHKKAISRKHYLVCQECHFTKIRGGDWRNPTKSIKSIMF